MKLLRSYSTFKPCYQILQELTYLISLISPRADSQLRAQTDQGRALLISPFKLSSSIQFTVGKISLCCAVYSRAHSITLRPGQSARSIRWRKLN